MNYTNQRRNKSLVKEIAVTSKAKAKVHRFKQYKKLSGISQKANNNSLTTDFKGTKHWNMNNSK